MGQKHHSYPLFPPYPVILGDPKVIFHLAVEGVCGLRRLRPKLER
jgi:hypothetical protein